MFIPKCLISLMRKLWLLVQSPCCGRNVIPCQELCQPLYAIERLQMAAAFAHWNCKHMQHMQPSSTIDFLQLFNSHALESGLMKIADQMPSLEAWSQLRGSVERSEGSEDKSGKVWKSIYEEHINKCQKYWTTAAKRGGKFGKDHKKNIVIWWPASRSLHTVTMGRW